MGNKTSWTEFQKTLQFWKTLIFLYIFLDATQIHVSDAHVIFPTYLQAWKIKSAEVIYLEQFYLNIPFEHYPVITLVQNILNL